MIPWENITSCSKIPIRSINIRPISIRSNKLKGQLVRSWLQWLQDGEKPSKYFSNLEKITLLKNNKKSKIK